MIRGGQSSAIQVAAFCTGFAIVCRWIKRNPSTFLRLLFFPFGGIRVERWPRIMLFFVQVCSAVGFYLFALGAIDGFFPLDPTESPVMFYSKIIAPLVISFFALGGSAEVDAEIGYSLTKPHFLVDHVAIGGGNTPPIGWHRGPEQPHVSDVAALPIPERACPESSPPPEVVKERETYARSAVLIGLLWSAACFVLGLTGMAVFFIVLYGLVAALKLYTKNAPVLICPFCEAPIDNYKATVRRNEPIRCPHCSEYSQFARGWLRPVDPRGAEALAEKPFFRSPVYEQSVWPNGCVLCGAAPARFDEAGAERFQYRRLATPMAAFAVPNPAAHVSGIPYCEKHRDAVKVVAPEEMFAWPWKYFPGYAEKMAEKRKAFLLWRSLPMMRRYLEANRRAHSKVSTGYRAPNLFQKFVTAPFPAAKRGSEHPGGSNANTTKSKH